MLRSFIGLTPPYKLYLLCFLLGVLIGVVLL